MNRMLKAKPLTCLALPLALLAASAHAAGPTTLSGTYSATIVDWPKGKTGTVRLTTAGDADLADGKVDENGQFSLVLPSPASFSGGFAKVSELFIANSKFESIDPPCQGKGVATPLTAQYKEFGLSATIDGQEPISLKLKSDTHLPYPLGQGYSTLTYFDVPTTLNGSVSCQGFVQSWNGTFPAGWSLPAGKVTAITDVYADLYTSDPLPANVTWHLYDLYTGIGVNVGPATDGQGYPITAVTSGKPADLAGVQQDDLLVEVNGKSVIGLSGDEVIALIRGDAGTVVTLGVKRGSETAIRRLPVTRAEIQVP